MAESSLEDRLRDHAKAFDGLLSLIPAKVYYGKDTTDQWKKKKQTKEEAAAARRAKLDPDSAKSAKDVMDERARKRKLEEIEESDVERVEKEIPQQGLKLLEEKKAKKQKTSALLQDDAMAEKSKSNQDRAAQVHEAKRLKAERKKKRKLEKAEKIKEGASNAKDQVIELNVIKEEILFGQDIRAAPLVRDAMEDSDTQGAEDLLGDDIGTFEAEGLEEEKIDAHNSSASPSPAPPSPTFDNSNEPSANTSTSSVVPPATAPKHIKLPTNPELLKARLAARIEALRAARKADGPNGAPARNRQELMEARRKKEDQRRAHKKELRLKAKIEADAQREAALASARDSPASGIFSPVIQSPGNNFSFGRVSFADGQQLSEDLSALRDAPKKRGPQDVATALQASEKKRLRLAGLDEEKRADIEEKDIWLKAKKRALGEKIRDDTSLLKKTLKRKEKAKKKSEKEWNERKEGIAKGQAMKQKKREENLRKRREEKGGKGKVKVKGKFGGISKTKKPKTKSRPGFEGTFGSGKRK